MAAGTATAAGFAGDRLTNSSRSRGAAGGFTWLFQKQQQQQQLAGSSRGGLQVLPSSSGSSGSSSSSSSSVLVHMSDGRVFDGRVVAVDRWSDLAVVKVDAAAPLPAVKLGDSHR